MKVKKSILSLGIIVGLVGVNQVAIAESPQVESHQLQLSSEKQGWEQTLLEKISADYQSEYAEWLKDGAAPPILPEFISEFMYKMIFTNDLNDQTGELSGEGEYRPEYLANLKWYQEIAKENWTINSEKLKGFYLSQPEPTNKTVILVHGFSSSPGLMGGWAKSYYDMGYNILTPELRGHGTSSYTERSMGWVDSQDMVQWVDKVIAESGSEAEIVLAGDSLGATTIMMTDAKKLPKNVKGIVADCGYSNAEGLLKIILNSIIGEENPTLIEKSYQKLEDIVRKRQEFELEEASALKQVKQSKIPLLIIQGELDELVPTSMAEDLYEGALGDSELVVISGAGHPTAIIYDLPKYNQSLKSFLTKYVID